jgi:HAE1 family hydrophobic/amphiphilic exporter-1
MVKTIAKLEGEYKAADLKLEIAKDSFLFLEAADAVVHDLLIAVLLVLCDVVFLHSIRKLIDCNGIYSCFVNCYFIGIYLMGYT